MTQTATAFVTKTKFPAAHLKQRATTIQLQQTTMDHVPKKTLRVSAVARASGCRCDGICDDIDDCVGALDECGVCNGDGIADGACDCDGNVLDECGVCGGDGTADGACDCDGNVLDECGVCGGDGIADGACDCDGNVLDECGVCGVMESLTVPATATATFLTSVAFVADGR